MRNAARNVDIDRRNSARQKALRLLANPDPLLRQKLAAAQAAARRNVITSRWGGVKANDRVATGWGGVLRVTLAVLC